MNIIINNETLTFDNVYYVNSVSGSDINNGSKDYPFKTFAKAHAVCLDGDAIYLVGVEGANYNDFTSAITKSVSIIGDGYLSKIDSIGTSFWTNTTKNVKLYRLNIKAKEIFRGSTSYNFTFYNCHISLDFWLISYDAQLANQPKMYNCTLDNREISSTYPIFRDNCYYENCIFLSNKVLTTSTTYGNPEIKTSLYNNTFISSSTTNSYNNNIDIPYEISNEYFISGDAWKNNGTGLNPDGSKASLGVYGGIYSWFYTKNKTLILHDGEYKKYENIPLEDIQFQDVVPQMTSDTTPSGIASASSTNTTTNVQPSAPWYAFNKTSSSDHTRIWYANAVTPQWLGYEFPIAQKIAKYSILRRANRFEGSPSSWEFQAFNETTQNWDVLDSISDFQMTDAGYYEFLIDWSKQGAYKKYRIYITATQANEPPMVNEFIMYKASATPTPPNWSTISSALPTSIQFLEHGMSNLSPLLDRKITTLEPMSMVDKSDILEVGGTGKVFSKTIDLKKYLDIRSIRTEGK